MTSTLLRLSLYWGRGDFYYSSWGNREVAKATTPCPVLYPIDNPLTVERVELDACSAPNGPVQSCQLNPLFKHLLVGRPFLIPLRLFTLSDALKLGSDSLVILGQ
jgi:hypothetical protein